jgi:hypothetical protein
MTEFRGLFGGVWLISSCVALALLIGLPDWAVVAAGSAGALWAAV